MTRKEYKELVSKYNDFLREAEAMQLELGKAIATLEQQAELSEDEAEYLGWMQDISNALGQLNN